MHKKKLPHELRKGRETNSFAVAKREREPENLPQEGMFAQKPEQRSTQSKREGDSLAKEVTSDVKFKPKRRGLKYRDRKRTNMGKKSVHREIKQKHQRKLSFKR